MIKRTLLVISLLLMATGCEVDSTTRELDNALQGKTEAEQAKAKPRPPHTERNNLRNARPR